MTEEPLETFNPLQNLNPNESRSRNRMARLEALAAMYAVPRSQRKALGLPLTDRAFADQWGVVANRIGKDKQSPEFERLLAAAKERHANRLDPRGTAALTESNVERLANDDLATYEKIKGVLAADAMTGDAKALELWLKTWGTPFVQEEVNRVDQVSNLNDRELLEEVLDLVSEELLLAVLKDRGLT